MTPPKVKKPNIPIQADSLKDEMRQQARKPKGRDSLISAGLQLKPAKSLKASLLGLS